MSESRRGSEPAQKRVPTLRGASSRHYLDSIKGSRRSSTRVDPQSPKSGRSGSHRESERQPAEQHIDADSDGADEEAPRKAVGVKHATRIQVLDFFRPYLFGSTLLLPLSLAQLGVWGAEHGKHPFCEERKLEDWFVVSGSFNLCFVVVSWILWVLTWQAVHAELPEEETPDEDKVIRKLPQLPKAAPARRYWSSSCLVWFQVMGSLFQFAWWIAGNIFVFSGSEALCGGLVSKGRPIFFTQYALLGVLAVVGVIYGILARAGKVGVWRKMAAAERAGKPSEEEPAFDSAAPTPHGTQPQDDTTVASKDTPV